MDMAGTEEVSRCALCGQADRDIRSDHTRTVWLDKSRRQNRGGQLDAGYFRPRLTLEEKYRLPSGRSTVCANRIACARRQDAKSSI